ncbi:hypothetical protein FH972_021078 [Carpinus fangiana]|uniref:Dienelactone hydrolase domain-containing protein n=1 Tax=Carpinus fangiana TaxID=176857 RepID=A0A5N6KNV6_9ROSI|nr:hypothetical protein FH972_021078 [Carpinus fangiana]
MSQTPSAACCNTPPIVGQNYSAKGKYTTVDGLRTYQTGPAGAKKAILLIYDIFGFFPQTLQGADILATSDKDNDYQVFIPDFFEGNPADISWYPPDTDDKGKKLGNFFETTGAPPKAVARVPKLVDEIQKAHPEITTWGILGFCWGGKVTNLVSTEGSKFKAAAAAHPAMVDPADAPGVSIPFLMLPSKDEDEDAVSKWEAALKVPKKVQWFKNQIHGFMGARGDLSDPAVVADYEKGYQAVLTWFNQHL